MKIKQDIATIFIILITSILIGFYVYSHRFLYTDSIILISLALIVTCAIFRKWRNSIIISPMIIMIIGTLMTYIIANSYANYYFYNYPDQVTILRESMLRFNFEFTKSLLLSSITLFIYLTSSFLVGSQIIKSLKSFLDKISYAFFSIIIGLSIYGTIFFIFASFGTLNLWLSTIALFIPIVLNYRNIQAFLKYIKPFPFKRIEFELDIFKVILIIPFLLFTSAFITVSLASFIHGPDGLRAYLTMTKYLADNGTLPSIKFTTQVPFLTEVLLAPAYILGGIPSAKFILNFLSTLYIVGFYLIIKDYIKSKADYLALFPVILFPVFLQMLVAEFKVDVFFTVFASAVFASFYTYLKNKKLEFLYLTSFFMSMSFLIKLTAFYYILPIGIFLFIQILTSKKSIQKKLKEYFIMALIAIIPVLPWIALYKVDLYILKNFGLGLSKYSKEITIERNVDICLYEQTQYENNEYFPGFNNDIKSYSKLPIYYLKAGSDSAFSILDAGAFSIIAITLYITYFLFKRKQIITDNKLKTIGILLLVSWGIWLKTAPVYIWYISPVLILSIMIIYISSLNSNDVYIKQFIKFTTIIISSIYIISFSTKHAIVMYFPTGLIPEKIMPIYKNYYDYHNMYYSQSKIAQILNIDKDSKILFTTGAGFANIGFFIDNYYDRAIFLDLYMSNYTEEKIKSFIKMHDVKYIVINNTALYSKIPCLSANQAKIKEIVMKLGNIKQDTLTFTLLEIK